MLDQKVSKLRVDAEFKLGKAAQLKITRANGTEQTVRFDTETLTATRTLKASESGMTLFLSSATEFVTTLPAPAPGMGFEFIVAAAPSGASYTVVTNGSANIIKGHILTSDVNSVFDADLETSGGDTISFVDSKAAAGDRVRLISDGTNWFAQGACSMFDAITITTAS